MPQDKIDLLYKDLEKEYDLGSIDDFKSYLSDDKKRESFFNEIVKTRYEVADIGTFENLYGLKKKEPSTTTSSTGYKSALSGIKGTSTPPTESGIKKSQGISQSPLKTAATTTQLDFTRPQPRISAEEQQASEIAATKGYVGQETEGTQLDVILANQKVQNLPLEQQMTSKEMTEQLDLLMPSTQGVESNQAFDAIFKKEGRENELAGVDETEFKKFLSATGVADKYNNARMEYDMSDKERYSVIQNFNQSIAGKSVQDLNIVKARLNSNPAYQEYEALKEQAQVVQEQWGSMGIDEQSAQFKSPEEIAQYNELIAQYNGLNQQADAIAEESGITKDLQDLESFGSDYFSSLLRSRSLIDNFPNILKEQKLQEKADAEYEDRRARFKKGDLTVLPTSLLNVGASGLNALNRNFYNSLASLIDNFGKLNDNTYSLGDWASKGLTELADNAIITPRKEFSKSGYNIDGYIVTKDKGGAISVFDKDYTPVQVDPNLAKKFNEEYDKKESTGAEKETMYDFFSLAPQLAEQFVTMYSLVGGGRLAQVGLQSLTKRAISQNTGMTAASYLMTYEDYKKTGIENGLSDTDAHLFASISAMTTSLLEGISPNENLIPKGQVAKALEAFTASVGAPIKTRMKAVANALAVEPTKEIIQEITQLGGDILTETGANAALGKDVFDAATDMDEIRNTAVLTFGTTALAQLPTSGLFDTKNKKEWWQWASKDVDKLIAQVQEDVKNGLYTEEKAQIIVEKAKAWAATQGKIPAGTEDVKRAQITPLLLEKIELLATSKDLDKVFQAKINKRIDAIDKEIVSIMNKPVSEFTTETETTTEETDGEGTIEGTVSAGTDVAEEGLGVATEPSSEGVKGQGVQTETVPEAPVAETKPSENISTAADSKGVYLKDGEYGFIRTEGQLVVFETNDKIIDLGNKDELAETPISEFGIEKEELLDVQVNEDNSVVVEGVKFVNNFSNPQAAINTDADGNVVSVNLETEDGKKRTIRGQRAEEIAYQYKLKEFEQNATEESIARLEQEVTRLEEEAKKPKPQTKKRSTAKRKSKEVAPVTSATVTAPAIEVTPTTEAAQTTKPLAEQIADLRAKEQAEYDAMSDPNNKAEREKIYNKYDKLITPLIKEQKLPKAKFNKSASDFNVGDIIRGANGQNYKVLRINKDFTKLENLSDTAIPNKIENFANVYKGFEKLNKSEAKETEPTKAKPAKPEAKKSKPEQIGEGLLDALGLAPVAPAKKAGKAKPVNVSNKSELSELEGKAQGDKKTIIEAAKKGIATLRSVFPDMEIYIHEDPDSYNETMSDVGGVANSRGNFAFERDANNNPTGRGRIDINLSNAKDTTVAHELVHAVLLKAFGDNPGLFKAFRDRMSTILRTDLNEQVTAFEKLYAGQDVAPEEYLTELAALLSQGGETVEYKPSTLRRVAALINEFVSRITKGKFQPFRSEVDFINFVDFLNQISGAISEGGEIDDTDVLNGGGEVGTFNFTSKGQLKAPKASEDSRDFIRKLVEDVDIREFNGKKFVTNMYDYTTAGVADLGNGFEINMLGGKNYVPYMMSKKNKAIGEVSNLAAFNTKGQAESFVRNAKKGKAELFAPHSGTLSASWQFQQHTFAELVNLLLDKGIMNNAELINTFNKTIESSQANQKAFEAFKNKYKENIQNFDSFKSDPKEIVKLLDIQNNYSPDLRKALNNAISADKTFQKAIGVKNKEEFFNKIIDPLNKGVTGGELINIVKFDPNTFEIVQTKPDAVDHHPSFGWTLLAKINGIYQPTEFHKSSEVTNSYTKYNKSGASVSRKATEPSYEKTNVSSSAGAIPKIAKLEIEKTGGIKSKAQVDVYHGSPYNFDKFTTEAIGTGEGAQAFGWGLYFTDLESIAKDYAAIATDFIGNWNKSSSQDKQEIKERLIKAAKKLNENGDISNDKFNYFSSVVGNKDSDIQDLLSFQYPATKKIIRDFLGNKGSIYKVSIHEGKSPSEYTFLNYDKPVSKDVKDKIINKIETENSKPETTPFTSSTSFLVEKINSAKTGGEMYSILSGLIYGDKNASLFLLNTGIDGIKYPAESISRGATSDTARGFNYVVFDENAVTIKSKAQKAQDGRIKEFVEGQRKSGQSDKDIKAGLELVADKVGLTPEDIDNLMGVESDEAKPLKGFKPKDKPAKEPEGEKTGTRAFAAKSVERAGVSIEDIPASLSSYEPTTVEEQQKIAEAFIRKHGIDNTITQLRLKDSGIDPKSKPVLASVLLKELYAEQGNTKDVAEIEKIAIDVHNVLDAVLTAATEAAQFMAMMREFYNSNPYNYVAQVTRLIEKNINNPIKANVRTAVVDINKANKAAAGKTASNVVKEIVTPKVTSAKANFERSKANLKAIWNKSLNIGIAANQYEAAKNDVQFAKALTIMAKDFVVYQSVQFSEFLKEVASQIGLQESDIDQDHLRKIFEKAKSEKIQAGIKVGLKELELKLKDLIESHYSATEIKGKLIDKLKSEFGVGSDFGLNDAAIKELEDAIKREIKVLTAKEKIKALKALGIKEQKDVNEILSLSEEGLLDDNSILETLGDKLGIKKLTPEEAAKLADLAKDIKESKEDRIKARNIQKFEDYKFVLAKKYKIQDFLISNYLTNIFGSLTSNEKNIAGNVSETILLVGELMGNALASGNPKDIQRALKALVDGNIRGFDFTKEVITTGVASYKEPGDIRARNMWELIMDRKNDLTRVERNLQMLFKIPYLGPTLLAERRFWNRALLSMDSLSGTTNNELGSLLAATREADKQKLRGAKRTKFIEEQMQNSAEAQEEARNYAISARYKQGTGEFNRAVANYLVSKRPEAIKKAAAEYSARATLTQRPPDATITGAIANGLNDLISKNPNIKFFVPVVNTFANLIVKNIERSPFEIFSLAFDAGRASAGVESAKAGLTKAEVARRMKTAAVWTAISVLLFALAGGTDDDEEGFEVFGSGTGDPAVDNARRALGWKPNTVRFSKDGGYYNFEFLPFGFVLGMIGNMRDYFKYKNKPAFAIRQAQAKKIFGKNLDALDKNEREQLEAELAIPGKYNISAKERKEFANLSAELALTPVTYSFQLLKSLGELVNAVGEGSGAINTAMKSITSIGRGIASPRYLGEVRDIFDNKLYDSKEFRNVIGANVPFVKLGNVKLDAFGREIEKYKSESILSGIKYALTRGFYNPPTITELDQFLWENGVGVSVPSNTPSMAYTEDVYREYIVTRGKILITSLTEALKNKEFEGLSPQDVLEVVNIYATNANAEARYITDEKLDKLK